MYYVVGPALRALSGTLIQRWRGAAARSQMQWHMTRHLILWTGARWMIYASVLSMVPRSKYWLLISSSSQGKIQTLLTASIIFQPTPSTEKEQLTRQHYWFVILPQTQTQTLPIHSRTILITQGLLDSLSIEFSTNIPYLFSSMMEAHQYSGRAESSIFQCFYPALTGIMKRPAEIFAFTVRQKAILKVSISK